MTREFLEDNADKVAEHYIYDGGIYLYTTETYVYKDSVYLSTIHSNADRYTGKSCTELVSGNLRRDLELYNDAYLCKTYCLDPDELENLKEGMY